MRATLFRFFSVFFLCLLMLPFQAQAKYASYIFDVTTGEVLHQENANTRNHPASLTKIMTLYLAFEALKEGKLRLNQSLPVSRHASRQPRSKLWLRRGSTIKAKDAILSLVTKSANDAAVVVAEAVAGSEKAFARKMTRKARELGMKRTTFRNASGLYNRAQLSTARDMATLGIRIKKDFPDYYDYFDTWRFDYKGRKYYNHNKLLKRYDGTDGIKTGYISAAGFNLVASVERNNHHVVGVVFGGRTGRSRDRHMMKLLDKGFRKIQLAEVRAPLPPELRRTLPDRTDGTQVAQNPFSNSDAQRNNTTAAQTVSLPSENGWRRAHSWGIQVGAYRKKIRAQQAARLASARIRPITNGATIRVTTTKDGQKRLYQARLVGMSEPEARQACLTMETTNLACIAVPPRRGDQVAMSKQDSGEQRPE